MGYAWKALLLCVLGFGSAGCEIKREALIGTYAARDAHGTDTLTLGSEGTYFQRATIRGVSASCDGRWSVGKEGIALEAPLNVDEYDSGRASSLTNMTAIQILSLDWYWLDRSLDPGEESPRYRRVNPSRAR